MFKKHLVIIILFFFNINMLNADAPKNHFNTETAYKTRKKMFYQGSSSKKSEIILLVCLTQR